MDNTDHEVDESEEGEDEDVIAETRWDAFIAHHSVHLLEEVSTMANSVPQRSE